MKNIIKNIISLFSYLVSIFVNFYLISIIKFIFDRIYWYAFKRVINSVSIGSFIERPMNIIGGKYIQIGSNFDAKARLRLEAYDSYGNDIFEPSLTIGDNVGISYDCHIACINKIKIGNGVLIGSRVFISDHFHGNQSVEELEIIPKKRSLYSKGSVEIGENVWLGEGVCIMPNVTIGRNSIIGANSVVTKSIPSYSVAVGSPAKVIKINKGGSL